MNDFFIMKKKVDKSALQQGISIPVIFQELLYDKVGFHLARGESAKIRIMVDEKLYDAKLINQPFDSVKYPNHADILQIRYDSNSALKEALRQQFKKTWDSMQDYYNVNHCYKGFRIPKRLEENILLFATPIKGTVMLDCISQEEYCMETNRIQSMDELAFEFEKDEDAFVEISVGLKKIRHLSKAIGNSLKVLYGYRCQICGEFIGDRYGSKLIHAHHIDYFTRSLNNDANNIMIVCPNHHGIIHDCNPTFNRTNKTFEYRNGYIEGLLINKHI